MMMVVMMGQKRERAGKRGKKKAVSKYSWRVA